MDVIARQALAAVQEAELDQERARRHVTAEALDELAQGPGRPARGEEVVVDEDPLPVGDRVGVDLERVDPVFEDVLGRDRVVGQLARLARRDEADAQLTGQRAAEDEPARLRGDDVVDLKRRDDLRQAADRQVERPRVEQQGRDVLEDDPGLGEVGDVADARPEKVASTARRDPSGIGVNGRFASL